MKRRALERLVRPTVLTAVTCPRAYQCPKITSHCSDFLWFASKQMQSFRTNEGESFTQFSECCQVRFLLTSQFSFGVRIHEFLQASIGLFGESKHGDAFHPLKRCVYCCIHYTNLTKTGIDHSFDCIPTGF